MISRPWFPWLCVALRGRQRSRGLLEGGHVYSYPRLGQISARCGRLVRTPSSPDAFFDLSCPGLLDDGVQELRIGFCECLRAAEDNDADRSEYWGIDWFGQSDERFGCFPELLFSGLGIQAGAQPADELVEEVLVLSHAVFYESAFERFCQREGVSDWFEARIWHLFIQSGANLSFRLSSQFII